MQTQENGPGQKPGEDRQTAVSDIGQTDMAAAARQGRHRPEERERGREGEVRAAVQTLGISHYRVILHYVFTSNLIGRPFISFR